MDDRRCDSDGKRERSSIYQMMTGTDLIISYYGLRIQAEPTCQPVEVFNNKSWSHSIHIIRKTSFKCHYYTTAATTTITMYLTLFGVYYSKV